MKNCINITDFSSFKYISVLLFLFIYSYSSAQIYRSKESLNSDWQYLEKNIETIDQLTGQKDWISINLPHTWNNHDTMDLEPGYRRSASWYKKKIQIKISMKI